MSAFSYKVLFLGTMVQSHPTCGVCYNSNTEEVDIVGEDCCEFKASPGYVVS